jgi:hypothetical protein
MQPYKKDRFASRWSEACFEVYGLVANSHVVGAPNAQRQVAPLVSMKTNLDDPWKAM